MSRQSPTSGIKRSELIDPNESDFRARVDQNPFNYNEKDYVKQARCCRLCKYDGNVFEDTSKGPSLTACGEKCWAAEFVKCDACGGKYQAMPKWKAKERFRDEYIGPWHKGDDSNNKSGE